MKRNHKTKKRNHKTIKKKHRFYAVGSGKMKTMKTGTGKVPKVQNSHRRYVKTPYKYGKMKPMKTMKTGTGKVPNSHRRYVKTPCKYGSRCYSQTRPFLVYNHDDNHTIKYSHPFTPPSPHDIITEWINSTQYEKDEKNLNKLIFGRNIDYTTNEEELFKNFIRYIVININQYPHDKIENIKSLLHRLQEAAIDYSIEVNNDRDKEFYEALINLKFGETYEGSGVIEFHGFELMFKFK